MNVPEAMKTLLLVRHAHASRDDPALPDSQRPLDARGLHDAPRMGRRLAKRGVTPELIVSSPALRALTTAQLVADELGVARDAIVVDDRLYAASVGELLDVVHALDDRWRCVMLVGHNPEFTGLAHRLASRIADMPTCAVAEFRIAAASWSDVGSVAPAGFALDTPN